MSKVNITWVRSTINRPSIHKRTIRALGFKHLNQTVTLELTPQIQGMVNQVCHLVRVEEVS